MKKLKIILALVIAVFMSINSPKSSNAGRSCEVRKTETPELISAINIAKKMRAMLDRGTSNYALIARQGSDMTKYGIKYTHLGIARKRPEKNTWEVVQMLNQCGSKQSGLFVHGLANFMLDDLYTHDVIIAPLSPKLSTSLTKILDDKAPLQIFEPRYSMISYPGLSSKYQNSNQWILETLTQAQALNAGTIIRDRTPSRDYYLSRRFKGTNIRISSLKRSWPRCFHQIFSSMTTQPAAANGDYTKSSPSIVLSNT